MPQRRREESAGALARGAVTAADVEAVRREIARVERSRRVSDPSMRRIRLRTSRSDGGFHPERARRTD